MTVSPSKGLYATLIGFPCTQGSSSNLVRYITVYMNRVELEFSHLIPRSIPMRLLRVVPLVWVGTFVHGSLRAGEGEFVFYSQVLRQAYELCREGLVESLPAFSDLLNDEEMRDHMRTRIATFIRHRDAQLGRFRDNSGQTISDANDPGVSAMHRDLVDQANQYGADLARLLEAAYVLYEALDEAYGPVHDMFSDVTPAVVEACDLAEIGFQVAYADFTETLGDLIDTIPEEVAAVTASLYTRNHEMLLNRRETVAEQLAAEAARLSPQDVAELMRAHFEPVEACLEGPLLQSASDTILAGTPVELDVLLAVCPLTDSVDEITAIGAEHSQVPLAEQLIAQLRTRADVRARAIVDAAEAWLVVKRAIERSNTPEVPETQGPGFRLRATERSIAHLNELVDTQVARAHLSEELRAVYAADLEVVRARVAEAAARLSAELPALQAAAEAERAAAREAAPRAREEQEAEQRRQALVLAEERRVADEQRERDRLAAIEARAVAVEQMGPGERLAEIQALISAQAERLKTTRQRAVADLGQRLESRSRGSLHALDDIPPATARAIEAVRAALTIREPAEVSSAVGAAVAQFQERSDSLIADVTALARAVAQTQRAVDEINAQTETELAALPQDGTKGKLASERVAFLLRRAGMLNTLMTVCALFDALNRHALLEAVMNAVSAEVQAEAARLRAAAQPFVADAKIYRIADFGAFCDRRDASGLEEKLRKTRLAMRNIAVATGEALDSITDAMLVRIARRHFSALVADFDEMVVRTTPRA